MNLPKTIFFLFFLLVAFYLSLATITHAQNPIPPGDISCDEVGDPEFHSLRPYQANPCDEEVSESALFCGNSLVISDTVSVLQTTPPELDENCTSIGNDRYRCTYKKSNSRIIAIDLADAELPIMGNTEDVRNSQRSDGFDDAEKVNEYVSWYLNGIIGRAENEPIDPETEGDIRKIVDFSGPLKKLLPWEIQTGYRIETIRDAIVSKEDGAEIRHNQIVACIKGLGKNPTPCYENSPKRLRLTDWGGNIAPELLTLNTTWNKRVPPLQKDFDENIEYRKAYNEWRGKSCAIVKIPFTEIGSLFCVGNLLRPNHWADLFTHIPFSSTEDRVGLVELDSFGVQPVSEDVTITNVSIKDWSPAELYFAHMQEVSELAEILQETFVPKDGNMTGGFTGVSPGGACDLVNVRTNEGDDLFAGEIGGTLSYDAEFSCDFDRNATESACTKEAVVSLSVLTKTPKADDVWSRTVAGPSAIFKRIFPKVGPGGAILGILDIPAATKVTYTGADFAGNPGNQRPGEGAELYFPHIGGISEYFLKGIQTILRPKGYGEQILSGAPGTVGGGEINCDKSAPDPGPVSGLLNKSTLVAEFSGEFPGNNIEECYNDVVNRARKAGYDPAFVMAIWIEESGASDYEQFPVVYDFGCMGSTPNNDFNAQISCFLNLKNFYLSPIFDSCKISTGGPVTMEDFLLIFSEGFRACDPNDTTCYRNYCTNPQFPQRIKDFYSRVSGGKSLPPYP